MRKRYILLLVIFGLSLFLFSGCVPVSLEYEYYTSPVFGRTDSYIAKPLLSDSVRSTMYGSVAFQSGKNNYLSTQRYNSVYDGVSAFQAQIYRVHSVHRFHFYYGGNLILGHYLVRYINFPVVPGVDTAYLNAHSGHKRYSNLGLIAGGDYTLPVGKGEWRIIGLNMTANQEYGQYLQFRKSLNDTMANGVFQGSTLATLGLSTEYTFHTKYGSVGFRYQWGVFIGDQRYLQHLNPNDDYHPFGQTNAEYGDFTFQYTNRQFTAYVQFEGGTLENNNMAGIIYRFWSRKMKNHLQPLITRIHLNDFNPKKFFITTTD